MTSYGCHLPKPKENNGKMPTLEEPNKIYIVGKALMSDIQKFNFIQFKPLCQKLRAFMSTSPKPLTKYGDFT